MRTLANTGIFCRCITVHAFSRLMGWVHSIKPWIVVVARTDRSWRVSNEIIKLWSVEFPLGLDTRGLTVRPRRHSTSLSVSHSMREISLMAKARGTITSTELSELGAGSGSTRPAAGRVRGTEPAGQGPALRQAVRRRVKANRPEHRHGGASATAVSNRDRGGRRTPAYTEIIIKFKLEGLGYRDSEPESRAVRLSLAVHEPQARCHGASVTGTV
jgi:hypothetical protein